MSGQKIFGQTDITQGNVSIKQRGGQHAYEVGRDVFQEKICKDQKRHHGQRQDKAMGKDAPEIAARGLPRRADAVHAGRVGKDHRGAEREAEAERNP